MDTLAAYHRLAGRHGLPLMRPGNYDLETRDFVDPDEVWSALQALEPTAGWLQFQSCQLAFENRLPEPEPSWGYLLTAEMATAAGGSLALNANRSGGWRLAHYRHQDQGHLLWDEVEHLTHDPKSGRLRYRRYWRLDAEQGYLQACACLVGLD